MFHSLKIQTWSETHNIENRIFIMDQFNTFLIPNNIKKNDCSQGLISLSDDAFALALDKCDGIAAASVQEGGGTVSWLAVSSGCCGIYSRFKKKIKLQTFLTVF